ncbi:YceK/YidQ family lipoprotein [Microbulbifer sp. SA54]|uniref:YceK/YidQ family lipoprotein n=1 Tax=Microbulbifer sp. SA54 TaxID=3401577 RepID=UPI003AAB4EA8
MPRVYSGIAYNMCKLNSNGSSIYFDDLLGLTLLDSLLSAATDSIALPYTLYTQQSQGNIPL